MAPIRILLVDDSLVIRKLLSDTLAKDPALVIVGTASDGRMALTKIPTLKPDLITLDIEMPLMNGLETLAAIRKLYPKLPVIMFSALTEDGAKATLDALALGASDYATKPSNAGGIVLAGEHLRSELIPKIKALCGTTAFKIVPPIHPRRVLPAPGRNQPLEIVAIGTSTGGPNALAKVLPMLPRDFPVPILVVQHMPPVFTRLLAERLNANSGIKILEGVAGTLLTAGRAYIAPGNFHMTVTRTGMNCRLALNQGPPENSCRPAVDALFRSVATAYGPNTLAVVMTGMGSDGLNGAEAIRAASGEIIVQDEASSVVWGMPGLVHASGLADGTYPLEKLAHEITRRVHRARAGVLTTSATLGHGAQ